MRTLYENLPEVEIGGRRLVGRVVFGLLVLVSVLVGATAGLQVERPFTSPQIFPLHAKLFALCHGVYGFEASSEFYFSKTAKQLTVPGAALLAGLPKGRSYYSPINHADRAQKRRNLVIN